jgi:Ni/Fe-hydrogenase 1 B-type cytochrome subunit
MTPELATGLAVSQHQPEPIEVEDAIPTNAERGPDTIALKEVVPVYVWEFPVRLSHWLIFFSIAVLSVTGYYIGRPIISVPGEAEKHFVMGWTRTVHFYAAIVFTLAVCSRVIWAFIGNRYARWDQLLPVARDRQKGLWTTLLFYSFVRKEPPASVGHNPMAGLAYFGIFTLYFVMILTGNGMYAAGSATWAPLHMFQYVLPLFGGAEYARFIHHAIMYVLLCFMIQHVYSSVLVSQVEHHGELDSIFSGWKFIPRWLRDRG